MVIKYYQYLNLIRLCYEKIQELENENRELRMKLDKYKILFNRQDSTASGKYCCTGNVRDWNR